MIIILRSTARTEKSRPDKLLSTEKEIYNITIFPPKAIINMKNLSSGYLEDY